MVLKMGSGFRLYFLTQTHESRISGLAYVNFMYSAYDKLGKEL